VFETPALRPAEANIMAFKVIIVHNSRTDCVAKSVWKHLRMRKTATHLLRYTPHTCDVIMTILGENPFFA